MQECNDTEDAFERHWKPENLFHTVSKADNVFQTTLTKNLPPFLAPTIHHCGGLGVIHWSWSTRLHYAGHT